MSPRSLNVMSGQSTTRRAIYRYTCITVVATFLLLIAGGLVTSTGSGLAVPDWPLSYGMWFPPMVGGILYEHGHRMIAAVVGMMVLVLAVWLWKAEPRRWVRRLGYSALLAVIVQAFLGGLTVLLLLPPQVSIAHACLGQSVFCLVVCLAKSTSPAWVHEPARVEDQRTGSARRLSLVVAVLAIFQLFLGAVVRHTGEGVFIHMGGAFALFVAVGWLVARLTRLRRRMPAAWRSVWHLFGLVGMQIALGLLVFTNRGSVALRTGHVAVGALLLARAVVLTWETLRQSSSSTARVGPGAMPLEAGE